MVGERERERERELDAIRSLFLFFYAPSDTKKRDDEKRGKRVGGNVPNGLSRFFITYVSKILGRESVGPALLFLQRRRQNHAAPTWLRQAYVHV